MPPFGPSCRQTRAPAPDVAAPAGMAESDAEWNWRDGNPLVIGKAEQKHLDPAPAAGPIEIGFDKQGEP